MRRWLFGDQLGPTFYEDVGDGGVLLVESRRVLRRRRFHRAKAHLVLSAMRHLARELAGSAVLIKTETYGEALEQLGEPVEVSEPTSYAARRLVRALPDVHVLDERGWASSHDDFERWVGERGRRRLLLEDFYREQRLRLGILMDGDAPAGGRWNLDGDNREPPPRGAARLDVPDPWWPVEDDIDAVVRDDLDRMVRDDGIELLGQDGPRRFAVTRGEATAALDHFVSQRLGSFGPYEDAMLVDDPWMAHSLLSAPLNLGLLHPVECAEAAEAAYRSGQVELRSAEGFVRQVIGWREYVWRLYWSTGDDYRHRNALDARAALPPWFADLDGDAVTARCLSTVLGQLAENGWVHHIPRLMVLGNWALQNGYDPELMTDWFHRSFVDGYDWVMVPNVVGMSQHADGGVMATKPYVAGGAYINRMSDYCGECAYDPRRRTGETACPFTAGYWAFLARNRERLEGNHRMRQAFRGLDRLDDLDTLRAEHESRGETAP